MDFVKINKERHAVKTFDGKKIPTVDVKQIISAASLAPSAHNIQPWHFVIVESEQKRQELLSVVHGKNGQQVKEAGAVIAIFSDTNLSEALVKLHAPELGKWTVNNCNVSIVAIHKCSKIWTR